MSIAYKNRIDHIVDIAANSTNFVLRKPHLTIRVYEHETQPKYIFSQKEKRFLSFAFH